MNNSEPALGVIIAGATAAEKLGGTSRGADADPPPFPPPSLPRLPLLLHQCFTHPIRHFSLLLPLNFARRSGEALLASHGANRKKRQPSVEVGGDQIHLVTVISKVGGDASHGSHRAVAPMVIV